MASPSRVLAPRRGPIVVEATPLNAGRPTTRVETFIPRTSRPRSDSPSPQRATPRSTIADELLVTLEANDLAAACEVAAWAKDNPLREEILRTALFARFPSPSLLRDSLARLRDDPSSQDHPGRSTLARLLASNSAPQ
ncbi:MAG: hypothetical protein JKY65_14570 [Planctomycetes bacterium]|nr:hypothetical protein [Planctomycetota bacterium]